MASRTKSALAKNAADQELHRHLADVRRGLDRALDVCRRVSRSRGPEFGPAVKAAAKGQETQLRALMVQVQRLGYLDSGAASDPDLAPESGKVPAARARREAANRERQERRKADRRRMKQLGWPA